MRYFRASHACISSQLIKPRLHLIERFAVAAVGFRNLIGDDGEQPAHLGLTVGLYRRGRDVIARGHRPRRQIQIIVQHPVPRKHFCIRPPGEPSPQRRAAGAMARQAF